MVIGFWIGPFFVTKAMEWAEELVMDGKISCEDMSKSTVYRWVREMNQYYKRNRYDCKAIVVSPKCSGLGYYCIELASGGV